MIEANVTSLHAVRSALQDAEARLADLKKSEAAAAAQALPAALRSSPDSIARAERAGRAIARTTGVPTGTASLQGIDELSALHRDKEIADRLAKLKSQTLDQICVLRLDSEGMFNQAHERASAEVK